MLPVIWTAEEEYHCKRFLPTVRMIINTEWNELLNYMKNTMVYTNLVWRHERHFCIEK